MRTPLKLAALRSPPTVADDPHARTRINALMILYGVTIITSAFLLFLVQPIIAKQILPWFGGSAAVWTTCVVFFQAVLLAGYAYAHGLTRRTSRTQAIVHIALLAISLATLPIIASQGWKPAPDSDPTWRIVGLLAATIGLPYFLLSSTGPLLQKWFSNDAANDAENDPANAGANTSRVYRLFALSNLGSLVGLLAYPFAVEPYASLHGQSWGWSAGYVLFAVACASCAWQIRAVPASSPATDTTGGRPGLGRYLFWLSCAALGSMLLLALTNHITQNVASIPFLWVLPLTLYLLSFVVVFEGRGGRGWYVRRWWFLPVAAAVIAMAWALSAERGVLSLYIVIPVLSVGLFLACVFCHGELAATKPAPAYLTQFYLSLSAGGALGGLFVALAAPKLFVNYWETPIALFALSVLALVASHDDERSEAPGRRLVGWLIAVALGLAATALVILAGGGTAFDAARAVVPGGTSRFAPAMLIAGAVVILAIAMWRRWPLAIAVTAVACTGFFGWKYYNFLSTNTLHASRNFYGTLRVKETSAGPQQRRDLMHGVILHGDQYMAPEKRNKPTTYYGPTSGIALALQQLRPEGTPLDVAMVGLGAGTLTTWGKPGDRYHIYELNPDVVTVARRDFTYLADSKATVTIALGDARLSMEREIANGNATLFDVIAVDAFSSDAIPVHLITREALDIYRRHLKPDGVIAFHVSNRFLRLGPVVAQLAENVGIEAVDIADDPDDDDYASSDWVLVTANADFLDRDAVLDRSETIEPIAGLPLWTDQFNNLFKILK